MIAAQLDLDAIVFLYTYILVIEPINGEFVLLATM